MGGERTWSISRGRDTAKIVANSSADVFDNREPVAPALRDEFIVCARGQLVGGRLVTGEADTLMILEFDCNADREL
jgi:hypothetical protein